MLMTFISYGLLVGLAIALVIAAATDIQKRQISNRLNAVIALAAPAFWWASGLSVWPDIVWQAGFALLISAILIGIAFVGYKINVVILGGGDIKLLAALSMWLTPLIYLDFLIMMAVFGGALAFVFIARRIVFKPKKHASLPYGVAIALRRTVGPVSQTFGSSSLRIGPAVNPILTNSHVRLATIPARAFTRAYIRGLISHG